MPLIFKKAAREDLSKLSVYVDDTTNTSPKYFRVSDVPQVLQKGKNLLRISAHPTNLVEGSQILVDVRDSNGNPIYFEIPDYLEADKSRVISIWIYHDKGDDNTANGDAVITLVGISKVGNNGEPVPQRFRGKPNVRWQTTVNVDRDRKNTSSVLFKSDTLPNVVVSESIEVYRNQPQSGNGLALQSQTGNGVRYLYRGTTPIVQLTDGSQFNQEMVGYPFVLSNYETPAEPITNYPNPNSDTFYSSSISQILDATTAVLRTPYTTSFADREQLIHTYNNIESANYSIQYFQTGSNIATENQRSFANLTLTNVNPIAGVVDKVKVLIKSDGLPGEYELLNEVTVPYSSSFSVKVPVPSENLQDPKLLKIQYLNSIGEISRTETITTPFVFQGGNFYFGGGDNLITGSIFISNAIGSGIEVGGASSGFIRSVGFEGQTSASLGKGPGGFIIYSGSNALRIGEDYLQGVGMQMIGDNDDRHFIFTTHNGGLLDVKTDKFFIGTLDSQFISGSNNNIEISSSLFHLDPQNNLLVIGADAVINSDLTVNNLRTPALINGSPSTKTNSSSSIDSDGFARFVSASIGGFEVSETQINSSNDNLILKDSGQITGSNVQFSGGEIAGFEISTSQINSANNNLILKASGQITASDGFLFGNKGTSQYVQFDDGNLVVRGDLSVDQIFTPATINGSPANILNASSSITSDGFAKFVSASIGGWGITTGSIEGGNLIMKPEGILQTRDFASGLKGWKISSEGNGTAEFENVRIRGTMRTTTFEKESVNAVGGQLWVANSTTITGSVAVGDTTMSVKNVKGFEEGEILLIKKVDNTGFQTEYVLVNSSSIEGDQSSEDENYGRVYIERAYGSGTQGDFVGDLASSAQSYEDGQVIVSTGKVGTGYIKLNANPSDQATPYMDIVERTGSDIYDVTLAARIGDLSGLANSDYVFGNPSPGYGLATNNVFLQGGIRANTGSIGGINMEAGKLYNGNGTWANSNTGFYIDSASNFSLGDRLTWNGSSLVVRGQIQLADGTGVEEAINAVTESSTARALSIGVDSQVYAFDNSADTTATPDTIVFTISQQNLTGTITTSDVTITKSGGSTITTPTLGGVVTAGSGQLSGSLSFSGESLAKSDLPLTIEVSKDSLLDTTTIFKVEGGSDGAAGSDGADGSDGTDAITAFLTNESHTFPSDVSGTISSFSGGETDMIVFQGVTDVTTDYTFSRTSNTGVTSTIADNTVTITAMTHDSGSVIITATSASVSLSKTMSLAKSKQGNDGADGADGLDGADGTSAKTLVASVDSQVFAFDNQADTSATPTEIIFSFNQQNLSGVIGTGDITITTAQGGSVSGYSLDTNSVSGGSGIVSGSVTFSGALTSGGLNSTKANLPITISVSKDSLSDSVKVFKVEGGEAGANGSDGTSPIVSLLSNESHTLVAATDGTVTTYGGSGTEIYVYEGTSELDYDGVGTSNGKFTVSASGSSITAGSISDGGNYAVVGNQSSMTQDSATITYTISGKSTDGTSFSQTKLQSFSKSKQGSTGAAGTDAKVVSLSADSLAITYNSQSVESPSGQTITLTADEQNHSGTVYYDFLKDGTSQQNSTTTTFVINTTGEKPSANGKVTYTVKTREGSVSGTVIAQDSVSIYGIKEGASGTDGVDGSDGTSAITAFLTNDSQTFPAASDGTVSSFSGGSTDMIIYQGIDDVTSNYSITRVNGTGVSSTISSNTITVTAMSHDSGSITITAASASVSIDKVFSLSKSKQGNAGADGADNQDFTWANENLTGVGPIASPGLLMTSNVFGFHDGIAGSNGSLDDFTSYLDSDGNFYLGSGSSDAQFVWDNTTKELLVSGSNAKIEVDKFFVGTPTTQFISGSNGIIEISSSKFHLQPGGDAILNGTIYAEAGRIASFIISSSKFDALRLVEEFTPISELSGSINSRIPVDVDSRATINITGVTQSNIPITSVTSTSFSTDIELGSKVFADSASFEIFYTESLSYGLDVVGGKATYAKFQSSSFFEVFPTASMASYTASVVDNQFTPYSSMYLESKFLSSVQGVQALAFDWPVEPDLTPKLINDSIGEETFLMRFFVDEGNVAVSPDDRVDFFANGSDLEMFIDVDINSINHLTSSSSTTVSSSNVRSEVGTWNIYSNDYFGFSTNYEAGSIVDGFEANINSSSPDTDFINTYWTASYSGATYYIWVSSASRDDGEFDGSSGRRSIIYFLTSSYTENDLQTPPNVSLTVSNTLVGSSVLTNAQYNTLATASFVYIPQIAERGGIQSSDWFDFVNGEYEGSEKTLAPSGSVLGIANNRANFPLDPTLENQNYNYSRMYGVMLNPGWFINPDAISILNSLDNTTGTEGGWWELQTPGSVTRWNPYTSVTDKYGFPFKLRHNYIRTNTTSSSELSLANGIWPLDIAESGSIPASGQALNSQVIATLPGRSEGVNITQRLDNTRVQTDLTPAELALIYPNESTFNGTVFRRFQVDYESTATHSPTTDKISMGYKSGSFVEKVTFSISGSGEISSSKFFVDEAGNITGSNVFFTGGTISGSQLNLVANQFDFGDNGAYISGSNGSLTISSSLFSLTDNSLEVKGNLRASSGYIQDTYLGGKIVDLGVQNPSVSDIRYQLPFIEVYSTSSTDTRLTYLTGSTTPNFQGSHGKWTLSSVFQSTPQMLVTGSTLDGVSYPDEFKSWYDISGVGTDYKFISNFNTVNLADATSSLDSKLVGNQLVFNKQNTFRTGSTIYNTITSEFIQISESFAISEHKNAHLQFAARGTTHPYSGGFKGFFPQYKVEIVSGSTTFYEKIYKDENATHKNWVVFDIPISDILTTEATSNTDKTVEKGFKVRLGMYYSGSKTSGTVGQGVQGMGWALTEMRVVEPARVAAIDTQTIHFKDTYLTWDGKEVTAHKGHFAPIVTSSLFESISGSRYTLGRPTQRWRTAYLKNSVDTLSDRNLKKNIEISPLGLGFVESLKPVKYDFKDDNTTHYGLIAQEVSQSLAEFGVHTDDFGGYNGSEGYLSLKYEEFIAPMIKAIQDQQQIIKDLQSRIETLESGSTN